MWIGPWVLWMDLLIFSEITQALAYRVAMNYTTLVIAAATTEAGAAGGAP